MSYPGAAWKRRQNGQDQAAPPGTAAYQTPLPASHGGGGGGQPSLYAVQGAPQPISQQGYQAGFGGAVPYVPGAPTPYLPPAPQPLAPPTTVYSGYPGFNRPIAQPYQASQPQSQPQPTMVAPPPSYDTVIGGGGVAPPPPYTTTQAPPYMPSGQPPSYTAYPSASTPSAPPAPAMPAPAMYAPVVPVAVPSSQYPGTHYPAQAFGGAAPMQTPSQQPSSAPGVQASGLPPGVSMYHYGTGTMTSACNGRRRALFIGICYRGSNAELRGCVNDVKSLHAFITQTYGYKPEECRVLTDDESFSEGLPTRRNIIDSLRWLVSGARAGDSFFLHYSGHGGTQRDRDGDEADGYDETILPLDFKTAGEIIDDELHDIVVKPLPVGVRLTACFDSCHSGSVLDLPYSYKVDGSQEIQEIDNTKAVMKSLMNAGALYLMGNEGAALGVALAGLGGLFSGRKTNKQAQAKAEREKSSPADVIQISGCRDDQTSADAMINGTATGAMSWALVSALKQDPHQDYATLLKNMRRLLKGRYTQVPQLSSSHKVDLRVPFNV